MEYVNLHVSVIDSAEFKGATPEQQGTFLCVLRYACGQESGDVISGCRAWTERQWQTVVGAEKNILLQPCGLWEWKEDDLIVNFYPAEQEKIVRAKRRGGRLGNRRRWGVRKASESESDGRSESESESVMKWNEMKGNEKGEPPKFAEIEVPSLSEFKAACEVRGIPGWYAELEHGWRSERPSERWPRGANWQTAVTSTFNRWRSAGSPMEAGMQKNGAQKTGGVWELKQKLEALREQERKHPANEASSAWSGDPSESELASLETLRREIGQCEQAMAGKT